MANVRSKKVVECSECGVSFHPNYSSLMRSNNLFCSRECFGKSRRVWKSFDGDRLSFREDKSGCHIFTGRIDNDGYGRVFFSGMSWGAHRLSYVLNVGPLEDGLVVRHTCDVPACINPMHLIAGTQADNIQDMLDRDRIRDRRGEGNGRARLSEADVMEIIELSRSATSPTVKEISERFNVSRGHIYAIRSGNAWPHITQSNGEMK